MQAAVCLYRQDADLIVTSLNQQLNHPITLKKTNESKNQKQHQTNSNQPLNYV